MNSGSKTKILTGVLALKLLFVLSACNQLKFTPIPTSDNGSLEVPSETPETPENPTSPDEIVPISKVISVDPAVNNPYLDLLLVVDDSGSMKPDLLKLAAKLSNFTGMLESSGMEWQMCLTSTQGYTMASGAVEFGHPLLWKTSTFGTSKVIRRGQASLDSVFKNTINAIPLGENVSWDERGIRATHEHIQRNPDCYRPGANVAVIVISDEDEASVGGIPSRLKPNEAPEVYKPLTPEELPPARLAAIKNLLGDVDFTFNSIIIEPGHLACEDEQNLEAPAYSGNLYAELSHLSGGGIGSICDSDYTKNLKLFRDKILNTLKEVELECSPHRGVVRISIDGKDATNFTLVDKTVTFAQPVPEGSTIELRYECKKTKPGKGDLPKPGDK